MAFGLLEGPDGKPVAAKGTADGYLRVVVESGGGSGGGDASAAHQLTAISRLDTLITDLGTRVSEITGQDIVVATQEVRDAITALGNGATLFDLFSRLGDIDTRLIADALTQADIASDTLLSTLALQAIEPDIEEIRSDAEDTRIATESIDNKTPALSNGRVPVETVEKSFPTFFATSSSVALTAAGQSILSIALAGGSSVGKLVLRDIRIRSVQQTNVAGVIAFFELRRFATHSVGTAVTPNKPDSADAISGDVTIRKGATIAGEEAIAACPQWIMSTDEYAVGAIELESQQVALSATSNMIPDGDGIRLPSVRPGEGMHVKLISPAAPPGTFEVTFVFTQE
jgi:hypothetical protein